MGVEIQIVPLIIGIILALFGWVLYWGGLTITGALFGGSLAGAICVLVQFFAEFDEKTFLILFIVLFAIGAFAGIFVFKQIHRALFFVFGALLGVILSNPIAELLKKHELYTFEGDAAIVIFKAAAAIVFGIIIILASKYIISIITSVFGTFLILKGVNFKYAEFIALPILIISISAQTGFIKFFKPNKD